MLTSIYYRSRSQQHLFYNLQLHILFLNPIQLLAVQTECKSKRIYHDSIHVIQIFFQIAEADFHCSKLVFTVKFAKFY